MADSDKVFDVVRAKRFILEDDDGRRLVDITERSGYPAINLFNKAGNVVIELEVESDNDGNYEGGSITLYHNNAWRVTISVDKDGNPKIGEARV